MKVGIIGFSKYLKKVYWRYLQTAPAIEITGICDIQPESEIRDFYREQGVSPVPPLFTDYQLMLQSVELDVAIISSPHTLHFEQAFHCIQAGLHVYLDKPLACRLEEARILVKSAKKNNVHLAAGNQRRYELPYTSAKNIIHQPDFGSIRFIHYLFANSPWGDYSKIWRGNLALSGGGALMDIGYLALDTLLWLLNQPVEKVFAFTPQTSSLDVESTIALVAHFKRDIMANITISYDAPPSSVQEELAIYGSRKSLFIRRFQPQKSTTPPLLIELEGNGKYQEHTFDTLPDNSAPLKDFIQGITNKTVSQSTGASHLPTIEVIESCYKSIRDKNLIYL